MTDTPFAFASPLPEGTLIQERYKLLKAVGRGGFGITYIGWDNELRRNVAVKECFPVGLCFRDGIQLRPISPQVESCYLRALDDMMHEARTLAALQHDRVVRVYDVVGGNGSIFCVMQWLRGGSLRERMAAHETTPITPEQASDWLDALLQALIYLHSNGVIHRDLKPENILFDESSLPVIVDFGAALNKPQLTTSSTQGAFSPGYAAPEQLTGKGEVGPWTDLFSLAATWYELLTGIRPESADKRLMEDDLIPLTAAKLQVTAPRAVLEMLQTNLALHPARRSKKAEDCLFWLRRGHAPKRVSTFLYRAVLPLILLAAAPGAVCSYLLLTRDAPAPAPASDTSDEGSSAESTPEEKQEAVDATAAALDRKLRAQYRVSECLADLQEPERALKPIIEKIHAGEVKRCDEWLAEMDTREFRDDRAFSAVWEEGSANISALFLSYFDMEMASCQSEFRDAACSLAADKRRVYAEQGLGTGNLAQRYRPADFREAAVLPLVAAQIDSEVQGALARFDEQVITYNYSADYCIQAKKRAIDKWNKMAAEDAASKPRELAALEAKIRRVADVDGFLKRRESYRTRYQDLLTQAQQVENKALEEYRTRRQSLISISDIHKLAREVSGKCNELRRSYKQEIDSLAKECRAADRDFDVSSLVEKSAYTKRERVLLPEAKTAVEKSVPECSCRSWSKPQFMRLREFADSLIL